MPAATRDNERRLSAMTHLTLLQRLGAGERQMTLGVRMCHTADISRMAHGAGFSAVWVDLEHSSMPLQCAVDIAISATDLGLEGWVRTPERDLGVIGRLLDGGVSGIIAPRIETVEEARDVVLAARLPPRGHRSQIGRLPQMHFRRLPGRELNELENQRTVVQILLESRRGIEHAEEIASIDGVDVIALGLNDLAADLGCIGDINHPEVTDACRHVAAAAHKHGKLAVVGGVAEISHYEKLFRLGFAPLVFAGIDTDLLATGLAQRVTDWRSSAGKATP